MSSCRRLGWAVVAFASLAAPVSAGEAGSLVGWVESSRGAPVAGALVSVFGKGLRGGSFVTLADSQGQFVLPSLPPGSYTLRAIGDGHQPSAARQVTVLPDRDALFTLSLTPVGEKPAEASPADAVAGDEARREWRWLVRHKRRSVLETAGHEGPGPEESLRLAPSAAASDALAALAPLGGSMELAATAGAGSSADPGGGLGLPGGLGSLRLEGSLTDGVRWSLGGLVAETEGRAWRTAAEFVIEPGGGHRLEVGAGYGAADMQSPVPGGPTEPGRAAGAVFLRDRWEIGERLATSAGARYTYIGFLPDSHHADAVVEVELRGDEQTVVRGAVSTRTLAPGGDLLTLSTVAASPAIAWARFDDGLRPARSLRYEVGIDRALGSARLGAQLFDEAGEDVLLTTFEGSTPLVRNAGGIGVRGFEVSLGQRFGDSVGGSLTYSFGRSRLSGPAPAFGGGPVAAFDDADFHDVVARVDAFLVWSDTRLAALYRLNTLAGRRSAAHPAARTRAAATTRFDVQLTQGLRFLQPLTRADWELLVAVRNMFYEASQAGFLDELAVQDPPTRVVGGISVRF